MYDLLQLAIGCAISLGVLWGVHKIFHISLKGNLAVLEGFAMTFVAAALVHNYFAPANNTDGSAHREFGAAQFAIIFISLFASYVLYLGGRIIESKFTDNNPR